MSSEKIEFLIGSRGNIDLKKEAAVSNETYNKFVEKLREMFNPVTTVQVNEFLKRKRVGEKGRRERLFHKEEYEFLLKSSGGRETAKNLGMPRLIVIEKTGEIVSSYLKWCEKNKKDVSIMTDPQSKFAEEYEKRDEMIKEYDKFTKKERRIIRKNIKKVNQDSENYNDEDKRKESYIKKQKLTEEYNRIKNDLEMIRNGEAIFKDGQITISKS
jgi:hypothetical protein